ncbi:MAG: type II toxin-antitoxin system HipA family toxin [Coriobacteriia bacterium]|nr:type II toxin-antitoxin system HipA family toxin [Coriobacteriia bacterium]
MQELDQILVLNNSCEVGTIARTRDGLYAFEYTDEWVQEGFSISPLSLPLEKKVFMPRYEPLEGMFGVFFDSLPDGWGRLLVDRVLSSRGENPHSLDHLARLAIIGSSGAGALCYKPTYQPGQPLTTDYDLDQIAEECERLLTVDSSSDLDALFILGGSAGGARPKILTNINGDDWIIKFPATADPINIGEQEYAYALAAKNCGIAMTDVALFESNRCPGYFGTKRFDRITVDKDKTHTVSAQTTQIPMQLNQHKIHMVSAAALLETTHRVPNLDYIQLMKLTQILTDSMSELQKLYKLMCFNVYAHNRDDHSKNFSFLYNEEAGDWHLSPAYDLTYSSSYYGQHATTVAGNGQDPELKDIMEVARQAGLSIRWARVTAAEIEENVSHLKQYWVAR